jgi:hypothetical protein
MSLISERAGNFYVQPPRRNRIRQIVLRIGLGSISLNTGVTGIEYPVLPD